MPHSVCLTKNWNASKTRSVPNQMYLLLAAVEGRAEDVGVLGADRGVEAVGGEHQVVRRPQLVGVGRLGAVVDGDAELGHAPLQDLQQVLAAHRGEALAADGERVRR